MLEYNAEDGADDVDNIVDDADDDAMIGNVLDSMAPVMWIALS